ncbi:MAG: leucyl/phenylalanyl-tRNA--protein transferase [Alphaproteobacteria bacterium]|nr:leucyl/phenylalanyl-tRNA--protein transferase [Alphaproteobacteria bacterium]NCQ88358.1 leucyl/phenylalanyl-tRNA--protein transferase [Alphaproteobacteria bacterium]NCT05901.1 leucyl/phenylalanyl-tRNA--protein transferase [Alphaproteobacteria bacterium]
MLTTLTPEIILEAYRIGIFPMASSADDPHFNFYRPEQRGLLPIKDIHIPKSLAKVIKQNVYEIRINTAFADIIDGCAMTSEDEKQGRDKTWINAPIRDVFIQLHHMGYAHSVECWKEGKLAGGLYGLAIGAVFCGESMVSFEKNASKVALAHLAQRLERKEFTILDTQFINDHLIQFGAYEIPQEAYENAIKTEMQKPRTFTD